MIKRIISIIKFSGIWIPPATVMIFYSYGYCTSNAVPMENIKTAFYIGCLLWLLHLMIAGMTFANGKPLGKYKLLDSLTFRTDPYITMDERRAAQRRNPPNELLTKDPENRIVIGKSNNKIVGVPIQSGVASHTLICGITGAGKSSCNIIPTILFCINGCDTNELVTAFVFDIKGELYDKAALHNSQKNIVIDPDNRMTYGWDLFWQIDGDSEIQEITDVISDICYTIIPPDRGSKNAFFIDGGRDLLFGLLLYYFNTGHSNFIDCIDAIVERPMADQVAEVIYSKPQSIEYKTLVRFYGMDEKTFADVSANAYNGLSLYLKDQNIRYMLRDNPLMVTPETLENKNIFLCMEDWHLENWSQIVAMICNQIMGYIIRRPEGSHVIMTIIDEWANIQQKAGKIKNLSGFLALGRSHGGCAVLVTQSIPALEVGGTKKEEVQALLNNIPYKIILSAGDEVTQRWIISQGGKVKVTQYSHGGAGTSRNFNYSKNEKDILDANMLMTLPKDNRVVVLSTDYGYFSCQRSPYFDTRILKKKWLEIRDKNMKLDEIRLKNKKKKKK